MTVRFYSSLDTGAPTLSGNLYSRVRQVLQACLVHGYGSKPGAGWTVGHDVAGGFSLGNGEGFVNVVSDDDSYCSIYLMEAVMDGSTALAGGINRRSGSWFDGSSSTNRQRIYSSTGASSFRGSPLWFVVADEKTCIFLYGGTGSGVDSVGNTSGAAIYFGRYINASGLTGPAEFCALGGTYGVNNSSMHFLRAAYRGGTCLRNPITGVIEQGVDPKYGASAPIFQRDSDVVQPASSLLPSRLLPVRCALMGHGVGLTGSTAPSSSCLGGYLRGVISEPTLGGALLSNVLTRFGLSQTANARVTPIVLPNGQSWVPIFPHTSDLAAFVSLDPADWE